MDESPRSSPLLSHIILWALFALLVVASVFTVVLPELSDQSEDEESAEQVAPAPAPAD